VDTTKTTINCLSFCSGIRGIERGLERVVPNLRTVCHVEIEAFVIENLVAEMEAGLVAPAPIWSNIKTFDPTPFRGKIHVLTGGYPCQPFSNAGKRNGEEDPRHLFPYIAKAVDVVRPDICFFENVRGHITLGLREVIALLEGMGYRVRWGIFSAEETGASHKRERVFIMAIRKELAYTYKFGCCNCKFKVNSTERGEYAQRVVGTCSCEELAHSKEQLSQQPGNTRERRTGFTNGSNNTGLADSDHCGSREDFKSGQLRSEGIEQSSSNSRRDNEGEEIERQKRSVARPRQVQHEWERPRTISYAEETLEPPLGCTAHGYRFREDFLRALGNSVYADAAELAWNVLSKKHGLI